MSYVIVRTARGRKTIVDSGSLPKMRRRLKQLRTSTTRGVCGQGHKRYRTVYEIEKEDQQ